MLKKAFETVERKLISASCKMAKSERGDTNFISILIVMGIVILLAGLFIGFKDSIVKMVSDIVGGFTIK